MRRPSLVALLLVVLGGLLSPVQAAPVLEARGQTVVKASRTGQVLLRLPRAATLDLNELEGSQRTQSRGVRLDGQGRLVGAFLSSVATQPNGLPQLRVRAMRTGLCHVEACDMRYGGWFSGSTSGASRDGVATLPAGTYRLTVLTDGTPVVATLRFGELAGKTSSPVTTALADVTVHSPHPDTGAAQGTTEAGSWSEQWRFRHKGPAEDLQVTGVLSNDSRGRVLTCIDEAPDTETRPCPVGRPTGSGVSGVPWDVGPCVGECALPQGERDRPVLGILTAFANGFADYGDRRFETHADVVMTSGAWSTVFVLLPY